jgi:colanic acid biosynthesis glycosyl transferase WcaI
MRILVHDYAGHPFQVQLSRELANRGHTVLHLHCASLKAAKGTLERIEGDPRCFDVQGVALPRDFNKYSLWRRPIDERGYALRLIRPLVRFRPEVVVSGNTPLISQRILLSECRKRDIPFVFWQQDILSVGIQQALLRRLGRASRIVAAQFVRLERSLLERSDAIVVISDDFVHVLNEWAIPPEKVEVIPNWAPLDELPVLPRDNLWSREHGLHDKRVVLYAGTLGLKHDPTLLLEAAYRFEANNDVRVVVVASGIGFEWLKERTNRDGPRNVLLMPPQPYGRFAEVLATGDVLVALLESDAGSFSVPSKVLSYLCAARAVLAAVPQSNLAARLLRANRTGLVTPPGDVETFARVAAGLLNRPALRARLAKRARAYAETSFDIGKIADRFEALLTRLAVK